MLPDDSKQNKKRGQVLNPCPQTEPVFEGVGRVLAQPLLILVKTITACRGTEIAFTLRAVNCAALTDGGTTFAAFRGSWNIGMFITKS